MYTLSFKVCVGWNWGQTILPCTVNVNYVGFSIVSRHTASCFRMPVCIQRFTAKEEWPTQLWSDGEVSSLNHHVYLRIRRICTLAGALVLVGSYSLHSLTSRYSHRTRIRTRRRSRLGPVSRVVQGGVRVHALSPDGCTCRILSRSRIL